MKKEDVKVGGIYVAKVTDKLVDVRIDSVHSRTGWNATNTKTGRRVHIKSAQRLRGPAKADKAPDDKAPQSGPDEDAPKPARSKNPDRRSKTTTNDGAPRRSALDAAAEVLTRAGKPMRCREMIVAMAEAGLWESPQGQTPHATLYAAIQREIKVKGDAARFTRLERGLFSIVSN